MTDVTRAEYCAIAIADCFADDGEIMGSPMGLLPSLGARLAKLTSNPLLMITDGSSKNVTVGKGSYCITCCISGEKFSVMKLPISIIAARPW